MGLPTQENREIRSSGGGGNYSVPSTVARLYDFREPGGYLGNVGLTMTLPNFLVIGAGRSGTTSLHYYLGQHPDIYLPVVKEPNFFSFMGEDIE